MEEALEQLRAEDPAAGGRVLQAGNDNNDFWDYDGEHFIVQLLRGPCANAQWKRASQIDSWHCHASVCTDEKRQDGRF